MKGPDKMYKHILNALGLMQILSDAPWFKHIIYTDLLELKNKNKNIHSCAPKTIIKTYCCEGKNKITH